MPESQCIVDFHELLPKEFNRNIELVDVFAIEVVNKDVSRVIELTSHIRNRELKHLLHIKLCKKLENDKVAVVYGVNEMPKNDRKTLEDAGIVVGNCLTFRVSKNSPVSKKQLADWSVYWPLTYNKPAWEPKELSKSEKSEGIKLLNRVIEGSLSNHIVGLSKGEKLGGCIITYKGNIIAEEGDCRDTCVLDHAVIVSVRKISKENRNGEKMPDYLCTGCDVYLSNEPCAMCAMALIHSRISNVYYAKEDPINGALGSNLNIHNLKGLNHSYRAFKGVLG